MMQVASAESAAIVPLVDEVPAVHRRFDRLARLFGERAVGRLARARVAIIGVGGVGSFAAEALCRSAVGYLTLIDFDDVCITNTNRQLQAVDGAVGKSKAGLLAERLRTINPAACIEAEQAFYSAEEAERLLRPPWPGRETAYDFVVDCIDNLTAKAHLIATCRERHLPIVSAMGAGGKTDPTRIRITDLGQTHVCPMAHQLRRILRRHHEFPAGRKLMGVAAVYSDEQPHWPSALAYDGGAEERDSCDERHLINGTAVYVTGAFGLACAGHVVNTLASEVVNDSPPAVARP
jgi:tRNA threonylcarbamoyladenosine dehydratase